jgi:hypothetical protein
MKNFFLKALQNISEFGDTDIFPFPIENHLFFDKAEDVAELLMDFHSHFFERLTQFPPSNLSALVPVSYLGFRWATQLDPIWNAYFLGIVLSIAREIEDARIPFSEKKIFSYRIDPNNGLQIFRPESNWRTFMEHSLELARENNFVVTCDISEFYPRLNHHRLDNALRQLNLSGDQTRKIMKFLSNFSDTYSFGLPVGGPAARILSEILLNQIDRLLRAEGIPFCRYADDFHLFSETYEGAFKALLYLSERLVHTQGLQLQKSKTRIMKSEEFIATSPIGKESTTTPTESTQVSLEEQSQNLLRLSVRFDPYSPTAGSDYQLLKSELNKIDIVSLLKAELTKSRIHISLSKKIVTAIKFLDEPQRSDAVLSLIESDELLYPIYANVLLTTKSLYSEISTTTRMKIIEHVRKLTINGSHVLQNDLNLCYAIRLLSCHQSPENEETLNRVFGRSQSSLVRRDIILAMAKWNAAYWLSNLKANFRTLPSIERRAFIVASFSMTDEGDHWRDHKAKEMSPFEKLIRDWTAEKSKNAGWSIPL